MSEASAGQCPEVLRSSAGAGGGVQQAAMGFRLEKHHRSPCTLDTWSEKCVPGKGVTVLLQVEQLMQQSLQYQSQNVDKVDEGTNTAVQRQPKIKKHNRDQGALHPFLRELKSTTGRGIFCHTDLSMVPNQCRVLWYKPDEEPLCSSNQQTKSVPSETSGFCPLFLPLTPVVCYTSFQFCVHKLLNLQRSQCTK